VLLDRQDVEPTNNAAERDLRTSVIHCKVTGGYRSDWGAQASMTLISILTTARKCGQSYFAALRAVTGSSPLQAAGMGSCASTCQDHRTNAVYHPAPRVSSRSGALVVVRRRRLLAQAATGIITQDLVKFGYPLERGVHELPLLLGELSVPIERL
jgi:hypothetical protein